MMIHDFDMARFLAGSEVTEVNAVGSVLVDPGIGEAGDVDTALVTLRVRKRRDDGVIDNSRKAVYVTTSALRYSAPKAVPRTRTTPRTPLFCPPQTALYMA